MASSSSIAYNSRDFKNIRTDLTEFIRHNYPDYYTDFNDASIGMMLIELNAAVGDMLSFNTDRAYQENLIDFAQERKSLFNLARTYGLRIPNKTPSVTVCDITVDVPVSGAGFNIDYCPILLRGAQITGNGLIFETLYDIDFSNPYSQNGFPNRTITPNFDSINNVVSYTLTKREIVVNGQTRFFKKIIASSDVTPFMEIVLPESDVVKVDGIITLSGSDYTRLPSNQEWNTLDNIWYEVETLQQKELFVADVLVTTDNVTVKKGSWKKVPRRFITEFTDNGYCIVRFGSGNTDTSSTAIYNPDVSDILKLLDTQYYGIDNGEIPKQNTTMFVRYRTGGGNRTNIGPNTLTSFGEINMVIIGANPNIVTKVRSTIRVTNPLPALGGKDELSVEEIRNLIRYNFNSQNRCVTLEDYVTRIGVMRSDFGTPYRFNVSNQSNTVVVTIVGVDENGKLQNKSTNTLKENLHDYLQNYNLSIDPTIEDGKILNMGVEVDLLVNKNIDKIAVSNQVNTLLTAFFETNKAFGATIFISKIYELLHSIENVLSIKTIRFLLKTGTNYSVNTPSNIAMSGSQLFPKDDAYLTLAYNEIAEIKYPSADIKINYFSI